MNPMCALQTPVYLSRVALMKPSIGHFNLAFDLLCFSFLSFPFVPSSSLDLCFFLRSRSPLYVIGCIESYKITYQIIAHDVTVTCASIKVYVQNRLLSNKSSLILFTLAMKIVCVCVCVLALSYKMIRWILISTRSFQELEVILCDSIIVWSAEKFASFFLFIVAVVPLLCFAARVFETKREYQSGLFATISKEEEFANDAHTHTHTHKRLGLRMIILSCGISI